MTHCNATGAESTNRRLLAHAGFARIAVRLSRGGSLLTLASRESQCRLRRGGSLLTLASRPQAECRLLGGNACGNKRAKRARFRFLSLSYFNERRTANPRSGNTRSGGETSERNELVSAFFLSYFNEDERPIREAAREADIREAARKRASEASSFPLSLSLLL